MIKSNGTQLDGVNLQSNDVNHEIYDSNKLSSYNNFLNSFRYNNVIFEPEKRKNLISH